VIPTIQTQKREPASTVVSPLAAHSSVALLALGK
jgi:hypothetical protein